MPKEEWGTKRVCPTTGKRFYDLKKTPTVSPYTGEVVDIDTARRKVVASVNTRAKPEKEDDEVVANDLESDDDLLTTDSSDDSEETDDDLLEDDTDDNVSLDEIADVSGSDDET